MSKVLVRGRAWFAPKTCAPKRKSGEKVVTPGLAMTPSDIERLAKQGIAVSTPNADSFRYDEDTNSWAIDPVYARDADRNSMWERSQVARANILNARKRDVQHYT